MEKKRLVALEMAQAFPNHNSSLDISNSAVLAMIPRQTKNFQGM
jgi:hypothetical protein